MGDIVYSLVTRDLRGLSDDQLRASVEILVRNGYPTRLRGDGESWEYRSQTPVKGKTLDELHAIGIELR